MVTDY